MAVRRRWKCLLALAITFAAALIAIAGSSEGLHGHSRRLLQQLLDTRRITISDERLPFVEKYCSARQFQPIDENEVAKAMQRYGTLSRFFQFDNKLIRAIVRKDAEPFSLRQYITQKSVLFLLPSCLGLVAAVVIFICLAVCICRPQQRPAMCESLQGQPGSNNPCAIISVFFLVLLLVLGVWAAAYSIGLYRNINQSQCQVSRLLDTVAYGGVTSDHTNYFVGIRTGKALILNSTNHVQNMVTSMSRDIEDSRVRIDRLARIARNDMQTVADKSNPNGTFALTYYQPLPFVQEIGSKFGRLLGSPSHPFSLLGGMYLLMKTADLGTAVMGKIEQLIEKYRPNLDNKLSTVEGLLAKESAALDRILGKYERAMSLTDVLGRGGSGFTTATFISLVAICTAAIVAAIGYLFLRNSAWRCCAITLFIMLGVVCLLCFIFSVAITLAVPGFMAGCKQFFTGLDSPTNFRTMAQGIGFDAHKASLASKCFGSGYADFLKPDKRRKIIRQLGIATQLLKVSDLITNSNMAFLSAAANKIQSHIEKYYSAKELDIGFQQSVHIWFAKLADHSGLADICHQNSKYQEDTLLPGPPSIGEHCQSEDIVDCKNFARCRSGCIDLTATMLHYSKSAQWVSDVKDRYGDNECGNRLSKLLGALYNNWHRPRVDEDIGIGGVKKRFEQGPLASIASIDKTIVDFKHKVHEDVSKLREYSSRAIDKDYGVLTVGMNCRAIGERAVIAKDSTCYRTFNSAYQLAIITTALSFTLLAALVLFACALIYHEQTEQIGGSKFDGDDPCCCCPNQPANDFRSSYPEQAEAQPGFEIQRIQSGVLRFSNAPSTAMDSRLYPIGDSVHPRERGRGTTGISWLDHPQRNRNTMPRLGV